MKKILHFIKYNNAFTIMLALIFGGGGITFAYSPDARDAILAKKEIVRSVDNSYLINLDLSKYDMGLRIDRITEDEGNYYVDFSYNELDVPDYVWKNVFTRKSFKIPKSDVGDRDLGLFLADQLGQIINGRMAYYKEVQDKEKKVGLSYKVVATEYSGLIGRFLDPKESEFPGYSPVIPEPVVEEVQTTEQEVSTDVPPVISEPSPIVNNNPAPVIISQQTNNSANIITAIEPETIISSSAPIPVETQVSAPAPVSASVSAPSIPSSASTPSSSAPVSIPTVVLSQDPESVKKMIDEAIVNMQNASSTTPSATSTLISEGVVPEVSSESSTSTLSTIIEPIKEVVEEVIVEIKQTIDSVIGNTEVTATSTSENLETPAPNEAEVLVPTGVEVPVSTEEVVVPISSDTSDQTVVVGEPEALMVNDIPIPIETIEVVEGSPVPETQEVVTPTIDTTTISPEPTTTEEGSAS